MYLYKGNTAKHQGWTDRSGTATSGSGDMELDMSREPDQWTSTNPRNYVKLMLDVDNQAVGNPTGIEKANPTLLAFQSNPCHYPIRAEP